MERRNLLKTIGGIGAAAAASGVGVTALSGTAAAAEVTIDATNVNVTKEDGELKEVYIDPQLNIDWSNFDEAVGAVSVFIEAQVNGGPTGPNDGYFPIHRSEPALVPGSGFGQKPSTTGSFTLGPLSHLAGEDNRADLDAWNNALTGDGDLRIADAEAGAPDYDSATEAIGGNSISGASEGYLQGANVYGATIPADAGELVNGEYGAAASTDPFDVDDGQTGATTVDLRYTVQFLELGLNHFINITGYDIVAETDGTVGGIRDKLAELYDATEGTWDAGVLNNATWLTNTEPSDITVIAINNAGDYSTADDELITFEKNQKRPVMTGPGEEYSEPPSPTSRHNADIREWDDGNTPVVISDEPSFDVAVTNLAGNSGATSGSTNGGAN